MKKRVLAAAIVMAAGTTAMADVNEAFRVDAASDTGSGSFIVNWEDGTWTGDVWTYTLADSVDLGAGIVQEATIIVANGNRGAGQTVSLNFNVAAGAANTVFDVTSGLANANLSSATGIASAAVTLTDTLGDGATMSPDGASIYSALYNGAPGTLFAGLLNNSITAGSFSTVTASGNFGSASLAGAVSDISSQWTFAVSAFDVASGTSVFTVIPAPGSFALLGLAGLAIRRRR
jgi:hypothetical protein